jgi:hypothetical protein
MSVPYEGQLWPSASSGSGGVGPTGPTGVTGPTGPVGATGPAGSGTGGAAVTEVVVQPAPPTAPPTATAMLWVDSDDTTISGGGAGHTIGNESIALPARGMLDFVGAGVTVTDDSVGNRSVVTIPGGGGVQELPTGGTTDQVLAKSSATNYAVKWADPVIGAGNVPVGGTTGQVLAKNSNTNYDTVWVPAGTGSDEVLTLAVGAPVPNGTPTGTLIVRYQ